jgi:hypothetical protein
MGNSLQAAKQLYQGTSMQNARVAALMCLFVLLMLFCKAQVTNPLEARYSFDSQRASLYDALNIISTRTGNLFIYDSQILQSDRRVKLEARSETLENILKNLLNDPKLGFKVLGKHILIFEKKEPIVRTSAQQPDSTSSTIVVKGAVYDENSKKPLQYVSVAIEGTPSGTITNGQGQFLLKLQPNNANRNIRISHIGYKPYSFPILLTTEQSVAIYLKADIVSLQEVVIRRVDPEVIVAKALENRKKNYDKSASYLTTFYREGVQKNGKILSYAEAIFKVYKPGVDQFSSEQIKELKSRKVVNTEQQDTLIMKLKGGISACLSLDIVKSEPDFLDAAEMQRYRYTLSDIVTYENRNAYAISFVQNAGITEPLYTGTMFIDTDNLAILGAEFEINPSYISQAADYLITQNSRTHVVKPERFAYSITYRKLGSYYYLAHAKCDIQVKARKKGRLFSSVFSAFLEMATCDMSNKDVAKFDRSEIIRPQVIFMDVPYVYDPDFWGDFNYIVPEEKLSVALQRINSKIEKFE